MVQKFVKELGDSAKQPDRSDSAERTATEQVETTAREIVHEAVQLPRRAIQHPARRESADSSANAQPEQSAQPRHAPESPRERTDTARTRPDAMPPQSAPAPTPQEQARRAYVQQAAKGSETAPSNTLEQSKAQRPTPAVLSEESTPRQRTEDIRTRPEPQRPQSKPIPAPQEQARRVYVQQTAKATAAAPSATLEENTPRQRTNDIRTRTEAQKAQSVPASASQEQGRRAYVKRTKKSRAEKPSARDNLYTERPEIRPADSVPQEETPSIREKPKAPEIRGQVQSETVPAKTSAIRHAKQPDTWTPRSAAAPAMRGKEQSVRERSAVTPAHDLPPVPQEQARQVFVEKQAQLSQNPSIESIYPSEPTAPILPQLPVSEAPAVTPEHQPVTADSGKPASPAPQPVQPPVEQPPAIREKPKPNAAPRERPQRGTSIRTRDTEQISAPKAQSKTSVSKIDVGVKRSFVRAVFR